MQVLEDPKFFIALLYNSQGNLVAVGDDHGAPFPSEQAADEFVTRYQAQYPRVQGFSLPITPVAIDIPDSAQ